MSQTPNLTMGIDVGDQVSVLCGVDATGQVIQRGRSAPPPPARCAQAAPQALWALR